MLYISMSAGKAGIFVRNSGTEDKISVNLRGSKSDASNLREMGLEAIKILFTTLKNREHHFYKQELYVLSQIASQSLKEKDLSCLLYTSPSPRDRQKSRMPSSA